jgi:hypothetical protein
MKKACSSATTPEGVRTPAGASRRDRPLPHDADAERAMALLRRGKPQDEIVYDDSVPRQSDAEMAEFRPAAYRREKLPESFTREIHGTPVSFRAVSRSGLEIQWLVIRADNASAPRTVRARKNAKPQTVVAKYLAAG